MVIPIRTSQRDTKDVGVVESIGARSRFDVEPGTHRCRSVVPDVVVGEASGVNVRDQYTRDVLDIPGIPIRWKD